MTDVTDAPMHAAETTVRVLLNILVNNDQDRWVTRDTAQAWINELKVVLARLEDAGRIEAERDEVAARLAECRSEIKDLHARIASHEAGCEHEAWESKHAMELALVKAERDAARATVAAVRTLAEKWGGEPATIERFLANEILKLVAPFKETIPDLNSGAIHSTLLASGAERGRQCDTCDGKADLP